MKTKQLISLSLLMVFAIQVVCVASGPADQSEIIRIPCTVGSWTLHPKKTATAVYDAKAGGESPFGNPSINYLTSEAPPRDYSLYAFADLTPLTRYTLRFSRKVQKFENTNSAMECKLNFSSLENRANVIVGSNKFPIDLHENAGEWVSFSADFLAPKKAVRAQVVFTFRGNVDVEISDFEIVPNIIATTFLVRKETAEMKIDGVLDESAWEDCAEIAEFFQIDTASSKPSNRTVTKLLLDDNNLYLAFHCAVRDIENAIAKIKENDNPASGKDEGIEFFVMPDRNRGVQYIVNLNGALTDIKLEATAFNAVGYERDVAWNSVAQAAVAKQDKSYIVEVSVPLGDIGVTEEDLEKGILINFCRNDSVFKENSSFSQIAGAYLKPDGFATLTKKGNGFELNRAFQENHVNPYTVPREKKILSKLLTDEPGHYTVTSWAGLTGQRYFLLQNDDKMSAEDIDRVEKEYIQYMSEAKIRPLSGGWAVNWETRGGLQKVFDLYNEYGIIPSLFPEVSGVMLSAINSGAEILSKAPVGASRNGRTSIITPEYGEAALTFAVKMLKDHRNAPYPIDIAGKDEPTGWLEPQKFYRTTNPDSQFLADVNEKVKGEYGFGKFDLPDDMAPDAFKDPVKRNLKWIAFWRFWTDEFVKQRIKINQALEEIRPDAKYAPFNMCSMFGIRPIDYSECDSRMGDISSSDPYLSSASSYNRAKYTVGFSTKLMRDINHMPEAKSVIQVFTYRGLVPEIENVKECVSQVIKAGGKHIEYFDTQPKPLCVKRPDFCKEVVKISKKITSLNKVAVPESADMAVLFSIYSNMTETEGTDADSAYTAHYLLGEDLHSWFTFVSDRDIEKGKANLDHYKVLIVPRLRFVTDKIADGIFKSLKDGTTVVFCDPYSFSYDIEGNKRTNLLKKKLGVEKGEQVKFKELTIPGMKGRFPIFKITIKGALKRDNAFALKLHKAKNLDVIATYPDGSPAAVKGKYGKGSFYFFAANPLSAEIISVSNNWNEFFRTILAENDIAMNQEIWDFRIDGE